MARKNVTQIKFYIPLIIAAINTFYYCFFSYKNIFNSDSAVFNILPKIIIENQSIFPKQFVFGNGDLILFSPHLLVIALWKIIGNQFLLHAIAVYGFYIMLVYSTYMVLRAFGASKNTSILSIGLLTSFFAIGSKEFLIGQGSYSGLFILINLTIWSARKYLASAKNGRDNNRYKYLCALFLILLTLNNPIRSFTYVFLPIFGMLSFDLFTNGNFKLLRKYFSIGKVIIGTQFFALLIYIYIYHTHNFENGITSSTLRAPESVHEGFINALDGISYILGFTPDIIARQISTSALVSLCHILFWLIITLIIRKKLEMKKRGDLALLIGIFLMSLPSLYFLIFSHMSTDYYSGRYLLTTFFYLYLVGIYYLVESISNNQNIITFIICAACLFYASDFKLNLDIAQRPNYENSMKTISQIGGKSNLLATYWHSGSLNVLSDFRVEVKTMKFDENNCLTPYYWLNSKDYNIIEGVNYNFLAYPEEINWMQSTACQSKIVSIENYKEYSVYKLRW